MKRIIILTITLFVIALQSNAYNRLRILNPRAWGSDIGSISHCYIHVQPKGLYVQYDVVLSFTAQNTYHSNDDLLEVELFFDLPEGAIINDSWLMINDSIVPADLIDRWTANAIYEGIVDRQKDPSILYKHSPTNYELRIFPIKKSQDRVAGISYLLPVQWNSNSVQAELPFDILNLSESNVQTVISFPEDLQTNRIQFDGEEMDLELHEHEFFGNAKFMMEVRSRDYLSNPSIAFDSPMKEGIFINQTTYKGEGYYQLAMLPSAILDIENNEKLVVLVDYDVSKTNYSKSDLVQQIKNQLHSFSSKDSFMLYYSDGVAKSLGSQWVSCDSSTIESMLIGLDEKIGNYSVLPSLLITATSFINDRANEGKIILAGASDQAGDYKIANSIMEDIHEITETLPEFYIADIANTSVNHFYQGGNYYYGNEYLYMLLTRQSNGTLESVNKSGTLNAVVSKAFQSIGGMISTVDLYTTLNDGFCYGRYMNANVDQGIYLNQPVTQVGKYIGDFPFEVSFSGVYNDTPFSYKKTIDETLITEADSIISKCWSGRFIEVLESQANTTESIHEIVNHSMNNRILSKYTAFLTLEPGMEIEPDKDEEDEFVIHVDENVFQDSELAVSAYPNPFRDKITITFQIPESIESEQVIIRIYNIMGQIVNHIVVPKGYSGREYSYVWDKTNHSAEGIAAGQYVVVITGPGFSKSINVVCQ